MADIVTIRPGLLVSLHTTIKGGVKYNREDINKEKTDTGAKVEEWKTTKTVDDPDEYDRAIKARSKCGSLVRSVCSQSSFGLLCPADKEDALTAAIQEARELADRFNAGAQLVCVGVYVLKGRIAESDSEAARAISEDMRGLLADMRDGIDQADAAKIRDACNRAKKIGSMLDESVAKKVSAAIAEARDVAKQIVKKLAAKESVVEVVQQAQLQALEDARSAFLEFDGEREIQGEKMSPVQESTLDLEEGEAQPQAASEPITAFIWPEDDGEPKESAQASAADGPELEV